MQAIRVPPKSRTFPASGGGGELPMTAYYNLTRHVLQRCLQFMGVKPWHAHEVTEDLFQWAAVSGTAPFSAEQWDALLTRHLQKWNYYRADRGLTEFLLAQHLFLRRRPHVCILLGGTSGCGKSTLAALLASRLGITTVLSTDHVRQMMRTASPDDPILATSSYHVGVDGSSDPAGVWQGFELQCALICPVLLDTVDILVRRREPVLLEGVHLSVSTMLAIQARFPHCIPFLLYISNDGKHAERFAIRAKYMTLEPRANKYIKYFTHIRVIQQALCEQARQNLIPMVDNTNVDRSMAYVHQTVFEYLYWRYRHLLLARDQADPGTGLVDSVTPGTERIPQLDSPFADLYRIFGQVMAMRQIGSKAMLERIRRKNAAHAFSDDLRVSNPGVSARPTLYPSSDGEDASEKGPDLPMPMEDENVPNPVSESVLPVQQVLSQMDDFQGSLGS